MSVLAIAGLCLALQATEADPFVRLRELNAKAEEAGEIVVRGKDGWLFYRPELRFLSVGPFWGEHAAEVSRSKKPEHADPLAAIVDFKDQLARVEVELLVVPVPPKALIYTEYLPGAWEGDGLRGAVAWTSFMEALRAEGVQVLDLVPKLVKLSLRKPEQLLYCRTDTHWSPHGLGFAAQQIYLTFLAGVIPGENAGSVQYIGWKRFVEIDGDLRQLEGSTDGGLEQVEIKRPENAPEPPFSRESPFLLIGDSHVLVFSEGGDMHAEGAGLGEHLAALVGGPIDRIGVRGSGAAAPRIDLLRRKDNLAGKKVVVWVFAARDLTEAEGGWPKVPVVREPK